jgi:YfiR/HmsC-like
MKIPRCFCGSCLRVCALLTMLLFPDLVASQALISENPYKIKAAFIRNFAHYVTWPEDAFTDIRSPWRICILGRDNFGEALDETLAGRSEKGRSFEIHRANALNELPACQIIYIAYDNPAKRRAVLNELKDQPVLTVGDAPDFLREGGIIRFDVGERVHMSVNLDRAREDALAIQTKMLEVSDEVLENGSLHKVR